MLQEDQSARALHFPHFPTRQQAVVWRNWELVSVERLALVLGTTEDNIIELARGMGLRVPPQVGKYWLKRGYITIIRRNWHLLPISQLLTLLGWTEERLVYTLKEDDFLWIKLGSMKPFTQPVYFRPLTDGEQAATAQMRAVLKKHFPSPVETSTASPFDFLHDFGYPLQITAGIKPIEADDIVINQAWQIVYPQSSNKVRKFAEYFAQRFAQQWQETIAVTSDAARKNTIELKLDPVPSLSSESHEIIIQPDRVCITAVDEEGLLRGLQWIERQMSLRGGPRLKPQTVNRRTRFELRLIYSYSAVYGDPLLEPELDPYPDELLARLSSLGVNGIWLHAVLYQLFPWEKTPDLSDHWEERIKNLRKLVARAANFGIGVYLYFNEPRAMPLSFFARFPELKGHTLEEQAALCTSCDDAKAYLRNGVSHLFEQVPDLAGLFTITMSENLTNCYSKASHLTTNCPRCAKRTPQEVVSEVNQLIVDGAHSAKPDAQIICWTWGYARGAGWSREMLDEAILAFPQDVALMCTSEEDIPFNIAGVPGRVLDYSMSIVGPGERSEQSWAVGRERGMTTVAKVQLNTTWECAAVPYLPAMDLVEEHLRKLAESKVDGLMLSWTLGGYPSLNLELASDYFWEENKGIIVDSEEFSKRLFGSRAFAFVTEAWTYFSQALREFPFHLGVLYYAPQNIGPANLLYLEPTGYKATMVGIPYDDLNSWRAIYPAEVFEDQFMRLAKKWRQGLELLHQAADLVDETGNAVFADLMNVSQAAYCHFQSTGLQARFVRLRNRWLKSTDPKGRKRYVDEMIQIIDEEIQVTKALYKIASCDSRIGYEASNHYFYTALDLQEKVVNCQYIKDQLEEQRRCM